MKNIDGHHRSCDSNNGENSEHPIGCDANDGEHPAANDAALNERDGCLVAHGALEQGEHHSVDEHFMRLALEQAKQAFDLNEVPIGAVVVAGDQVIAAAYNRREIDADPASHAEFSALELAAKKLGRWRLSDCSVYVTLEPCLMCAGLMYQARIKRCVYGAKDPKAGALGSLYEVHKDTRLNHCFEVQSGVLENESANLLKTFFAKLRKKHSLQ